MKNLLTFAMSILLVLATVPIAAEKETRTVYCDGFELFKQSDGTYIINGFADELLDENGTLIIPDELNGRKVTAIGSGFEGSMVRHIILPETIEIVGLRYFSKTDLESINLNPDQHMKLYTGSAPSNPRKLKTFTADGENRISPLWEIGNSVFAGTSVETIILDRNLEFSLDRDLGGTFIEDCVFGECRSLRTVFITDNVKKIGGGPLGNFYLCTGLDYLCFPGSIEGLGLDFPFCTSLRTAVFPAKDVEMSFYTDKYETWLRNEAKYGEEHMNSLGTCYTTFQNCPKLTIFGKSGTTVEDYAKKANIPFIGSIIIHGEPSTVVAQAAQTATVWLNGYEIPAYTVNGSVYVGESALKSFGFGMDWDNETRTTTVTKPESVQWAVELNTNPEPYSLDVYSSDVKFMMNGFPIPYLCVGYGESIVDVNAIAEAVLY